MLLRRLWSVDGSQPGHTLSPGHNGNGSDILVATAGAWLFAEQFCVDLSA